MDGNFGAPKAIDPAAAGRQKAAEVSAMVTAACSGRLKLPLVPRVVTNLIIQLKSPTVSINDIVRELEQDPMLAARVLRMANSPFFCGYRSVASVSEAVVTVGTEALRTLIISCGIAGAFVDVPGVNLRAFWVDSTLTGHAARELARLSRDDMNAAFLCGLLHRTGHLILCMSYPGQAKALLDAPHPCPPKQLEELEMEAFNLSHRGVGAAWLDSLALPLVVVGAVRDYLEPIAPGANRCAVLLRLASQIAASIADGVDEDTARARLDPLGIAALHIEDEIAGRRFSTMYSRLIEGETS